MEPEDLAIAQLVHDLRNQLTLIVECADVLSGLVPRGPAERQIAELRACVERASLLTREMLLAGRPQARRRSVDLRTVVGSAVTSLSRVIDDRIRVEVYAGPDPLPVTAAFVELERIVVNLVLNARDSMVGDGVLRVETSGAGLDALLTVADTGTGLTSEVRRRMFEPSPATGDTITGLGLSAVATTVQQLGGLIAVEGAPAGGTFVTVRLPLAASADLT